MKPTMRTKLVMAEAHELNLQLSLLAAQAAHHNSLACRNLHTHFHGKSSIAQTTDKGPNIGCCNAMLPDYERRQNVTPHAIHKPHRTADILTLLVTGSKWIADIKHLLISGIYKVGQGLEGVGG